ncbi:MAG: serine/threonine protein kinase [Nostoc sp.]
MELSLPSTQNSSRMELLHQKEDIIAHQYRILDTLGQGGSGTTYLAQDLKSTQQVALKALSLHRMTDWKMMELFEREAKILSQLNHPGIPEYLGYFQIETLEDRYFYIAQQLAEGKTLAALVESRWRTSEDEVRRIAIQILEILIYLHSLKPPVVHRDIKPQNIIRRDDGQVFLVDFGAVQHTYYTTFMRGSTVVGTYGYMAPEQFRGQAVPATDLYALGATLLFLLTHCSPADLQSDGLKINFRPRVQISEEFADWLEKMLEPDTEDRFSSAQEAWQVLQGKRKLTVKSNVSVRSEKIVRVAVSTLAPGTSLATLVENGWLPDEEEVRQIAIEMLKILIYLHSLTPPVIHRDIKPQNILFASEKRTLLIFLRRRLLLSDIKSLFLVDFGAVADTYHNTVTGGSTVVGTFGYMAPEQFRGQAFPSTDLYGLGTTLLFLLTGKSPSDLPQRKLKIDFRPDVNISKDFANWLEQKNGWCGR